MLLRCELSGERRGVRADRSPAVLRVTASRFMDVY